MAIEAKIGLLRDRVIEGGREFEVLRGRGGWRRIIDPHGPARGVRYDGWRDRLSIASPTGPLEIRFRWRNTTFTYHGRTYRVGSMIGNRVTIFEDERPIVEGRLTWSGVSLERIDPAFHEIRQELAVGLALRAQAIATAFVPMAVVPLM